MTKIITLANSKGGAGKSTTALALISAIEATGRSVIAADLDNQGTLAELISSNTDGKYRLPLTEKVSIEPVYFSDDDNQNAKLTAERIAELEKLSPDFLIMDTKGKASATATWAMFVADLVLCPTSGDAAEFGPVTSTFKNFSDALVASGEEEDPHERFRVMFNKNKSITPKEILLARTALKEHFKCLNGLPDLSSFNAAAFNGTTLLGLVEYSDDLATNGVGRERSRGKQDKEKFGKALSASLAMLEEIEKEIGNE